ncbi:hypothetical protein BH11MYX4_BH11MYX4_19590 [soil metagenome]
MRLRSSRAFVRPAVFALTLAAFALRAAPALAGDEAAAEALFLEAKKLAAAGKLAEACPKFAESNRLDRGAGTLIHLADCYEKNGQSASAWATFKDAASAAQALGRADWQKLATQRAAALEPKLAKLTIKVQDPADKIEVTRDGAPTSPASWGTPIPVDVGAHAVQATAPSRTTFKTSIKVAKDGDRVDVVVPKLDAAPAAAAVPPPPAAVTPPPVVHSGDDGAGQRTIGLVVGGVGVAGVAVGAITGLIAMGKNSDSKKACPNDGACASTDAVDANDSAKTFGLVSTVAFIAGGVAVATGAILIFTAPSDKGTRAAKSERGIRVVPATDGRSANVAVMGVF